MISWGLTIVMVGLAGIFGFQQHNWLGFVLMVVLWFAFFSLIGAHVSDVKNTQRIKELEALVASRDAEIRATTHE
jgi:uncharacterized protein (DUF58 family)